MMRHKHVKIILFLWFAVTSIANAQQGRVNVDSLRKIYFLQDTVDSAAIVPIAIDTLTPKTLKPLDSLTKAQIIDSLRGGFGFQQVDFKRLVDEFILQSISSDPHQRGDLLPKGQFWVLAFVFCLLLLFAVLRQSFSKQLTAIVESFFSNRILANLSKEDNVFTSWPFLLLFVQFGFTLGMFCYLAAQYQELPAAKGGVSFFITISILIIVLYALKILLLRVMGYVFEVQKPVGDYVSILYLSYFNMALLFIPIVVAFALSPLKYGAFYIAIALVLLTVIFVFQSIRAGINILSNYRFPKVYLVLYFCTLEICPILILIKAIGF